MLELTPGALGGARADGRGDAAPSALLASSAPDLAGRTARAVVEDLARRVAQTRADRLRRRRDVEAQGTERFKATFSRRYGVDAASGTNLAQIAREFGVSEPRICQLLSEMRVEFGLAVADKAVFEAMRIAARPHLPCPEVETARELLALTAPNITLRGLSSFVPDILGEDLFAIERIVTGSDTRYMVRDPAVSIAPVPARRESSALYAMAGPMLRNTGAAHMGHIRLDAVDEGWDAKVLASIPDTLAARDGFEWLEDGTPGNPPKWFWFDEQSARWNPVVAAARRILARAGQPVNLSTLIAGIDRVRLFRSSRHELGETGSVIPPLHVVQHQLRRLSFLRWSDGEVPSCVARSSLIPREELWENDLPVFESLVRRGSPEKKSWRTCVLPA